MQYGWIILYVIHTRTRARSLIFATAASVLLGGLLVGCSSDPVEDQRRDLEKRGYSKVKVVQAKTHPYIYSAVVNDCTVELFIAQDQDVWYVSIDTLADGRSMRDLAYPAGYGVFKAIGSEEELRSSERFAAICP